MAGLVENLSDASFDEEVKGSEQPVLVDFWASWCGPCRTIAPILEEVATEKSDQLRIAKVNVDENPELTSRYEVQSIPTLLLFKDGDVTPLRIVGARSRQQLLADIEPYLS